MTPAPDVLLVIGQLEGGGAEKHCFDLAASFEALGVKVRVAGTQTTPATQARYEAAGVPLSLLGPAPVNAARLGFSLARMRRFAGRWNALRRLLREQRPFLVHSFLPYANVLLGLQRLSVGIPVHVAGHRFAAWAGPVYNVSQALQMLLCRSCELNLANSRDVAAFLVNDLHLPPGQVATAVNGISCGEAKACARERAPARRELGLEEADVAVGMVANLWPYKGIGDLQLAAAEAGRRGVDLRVFVVGRDVGTLAGFEAESRRLGISERFRFLGGRSDVCRLLRAFDIFVSPSRGEGMSNAILEAMAHGLPVVGSRAAGTPEMLGDGSAGRLFDVGDWQALAGHLGELAASLQERARLGAAALARVHDTFRPERMVSETLQAYARASAAHEAEAGYFLEKAREAGRGLRGESAPPGEGAVRRSS